MKIILGVRIEGGGLFALEVAAVLERDEALRDVLHHKFPGATVYGAYEDGAWRDFQFAAGAMSIVFGGPPCQDVAPTGRGRLGLAGRYGPSPRTPPR